MFFLCINFRVIWKIWNVNNRTVLCYQGWHWMSPLTEKIKLIFVCDVYIELGECAQAAGSKCFSFILDIVYSINVSVRNIKLLPVAGILLFVVKKDVYRGVVLSIEHNRQHFSVKLVYSSCFVYVYVYQMCIRDSA